MSNETTNVPAYVTFVAALRAKAAEMGIPLIETEGTSTGLPENKNWVRLESPLNGHKFYVPKSAAVMGQCETTLPIQHLNGARPLPKVNGKIVTRFLPLVDTIASEQVLGLFASPDDRLPANRPPTRKATV